MDILNNNKIISLTLLVIIGLIYCMDVIPERAEIIYYNPKHIKYITANVRRYGRASRYYINLRGHNYNVWNDNVTALPDLKKLYVKPVAINVRSEPDVRDSWNYIAKQTHFIFMEYLHNEYRRSFIEFHLKLCSELLGSDIYVGGTFRSAGITCPIFPGDHNLENMTAPTQNFPNVFPFQRGRIDVEVVVTGTKEVILNGTAHVKFEQVKKRKN